METMGVSQLRVDRLVVRSIFSRDFLWIFLSLKKDPELADLLKMPGKSSKQILPSWGFSGDESHGIPILKKSPRKEIQGSLWKFRNCEKFSLGMRVAPPTVADRWDPRILKDVGSLKRTFSPLKMGFPKRKRKSIPTNHFQVRKCKF